MKYLILISIIINYFLILKNAGIITEKMNLLKWNV